MQCICHLTRSAIVIRAKRAVIRAKRAVIRRTSGAPSLPATDYAGGGEKLVAAPVADVALVDDGECGEGGFLREAASCVRVDVAEEEARPCDEV